jgi:glyoxylase-like metal-dependent hydrolase (beta-lactamase superfamily II)
MREHGPELTREGAFYPSPARDLEYLPDDPPEPGQARRVADGLLWMRVPLPMELNHINLWLLEDGDACTAVDTGLASDVCREAWLSLEQVALAGRSLARVFVTHDHADHFGLASWLAERHGAEVWMSQVAHESSSVFLRTEPDVIGQRLLDFVRRHGLELKPGDDALIRGDHRTWFSGIPALSRAPVDGQSLAFGGARWQAIETGGHCRGHLCLHDAERGILVSGDQVLPSISPNVSVLASAPDADPLRAFLVSLARLEACAPGTLVLPSHGRPFRALHRRIADLRNHHLEQLGKLEAFCSEPRSACDAMPLMFGRVLRGFHRLLALGEALAHLHYLASEKRVERLIGAEGQIRFVRA